MQFLNMTFIGGCHINGYPIGKKFSFPNILKNKIQRDNKISVNTYTKEHVNLQNFSEKFRNLPEAEKENNIIILQLGNYETSKPLINKSKKIQNQKKRQQKSSHFLYQVLYFFLNNFLKTISINNFEKKKFNKEYLSILNFLLFQNYGKLIIITPFPSLHFNINLNRRYASELFIDEACKINATVIDTFHLFCDGNTMFPYLPNPEYFEDIFHLNSKGHILLADKIYKVLRSCE